MILDTLEDISDSTGMDLTKVMQLAITDYNFRLEHKINHGGDVMMTQWLLSSFILRGGRRRGRCRRCRRFRRPCKHWSKVHPIFCMRDL